jgi:hypothetical protein
MQGLLLRRRIRPSPAERQQGGKGRADNPSEGGPVGPLRLPLRLGKASLTPRPLVHLRRPSRCGPHPRSRDAGAMREESIEDAVEWHPYLGALERNI